MQHSALPLRSLVAGLLSLALCPLAGPVAAQSGSPPAADTAAADSGAAPAGGPRAAIAAPPVQESAVVRVVAGARYDAGPLRRLLNGDNWRSLWLQALDVPVLDLERTGGGLTPDHEGGNQSRTLHFNAPDGRTYIFRSTDKFVGQILPEDLQDTWTEQVMQDHVSAFHPTGGLVVPALHEALGLLAVPGRLVVLPDDPRLGEFRDRFAGMVGLLVERPNEGEGDRPLYGGFSKIIGNEEFYEKIEEHPVNRVDARAYLASRLIDFVVGDTDRGQDQWRWAREQDGPLLRWRPIARDRDWAFVNADGLLARAARLVFPKLPTFDHRIPDIETLTFGDRGLARTILPPLDRADWREVTARVETGLTDEVINDAVALLPPEHRRGHAGLLAAAMKTRRAQLADVADVFYHRLSSDVDVRGTDIGERAEIVRRPDGTVTVRLLAPAEAVAVGRARELATGEGAPESEPAVASPGDGGGAWQDAWLAYFERTFVPGETDEVRVYLHGGDDTALVTGGGAEAIAVRVIGGGGNDVLRDEASAGGRTVLYDSQGDNELAGGLTTRIETRPYDEREEPEGFLEYQLGRDRDWGSEASWLNPAFDYREGAGVILGAGPTWTEYGFRHRPFDRQLSVKGLVGTASGDLAIDVLAEATLENRPLRLLVHARASQLEAVRFFGLGNDTDDLPGAVSLVPLDQVLVEPALALRSARWEGRVGPVLRWTRPHVPAGNPAAGGGTDLSTAVDGWNRELGARGELMYRQVDDEGLPTRGWQAAATLSGYPGLDEGAAHAGATGEALGYVPVPVTTGSSVAVRLGARTTFGDPPLHDLAWIGGRTTLRGYSWQRFAGDAALYGGAELRLALGRVNLGLARGLMGMLGLVDAGRVYFDGQSSGDWHTGYGAGVFFATLGTAVNVVWAHGEGDRLYAGLGLPF